ncbi:THAP domain containing protein 4 [Dissostichus eleginoides]|uniref:THAP domain containing protein 4 n=1 Tax=Dissostichus eleginoides TaxID=100907 RepID=A0AAD9F4D1_DISEL|nr:THAP domain containing protein 4 [Dissostichus eleginoides]
MSTYISELGVSLDEDEEQQLQSGGFKKINVDLNKKSGGKDIYLWYKHGSVPITKVQISFKDKMAVGLINAGYTKINKDLNAAAGDTDHFKAGYIRVDEDTNRVSGISAKNYQPVNVNLNEGAKGVQEYLWYKKEGSKNPIKAITLLLNKDVITDYMRAGVQVIKKDLNTGNKCSYELLCFQ